MNLVITHKIFYDQIVRISGQYQTSQWSNQNHFFWQFSYKLHLSFISKAQNMRDTMNNLIWPFSTIRIRNIKLIPCSKLEKMAETHLWIIQSVQLVQFSHFLKLINLYSKWYSSKLIPWRKWPQALFHAIWIIEKGIFAVLPVLYLINPSDRKWKYKQEKSKSESSIFGRKMTVWGTY